MRLALGRAALALALVAGCSAEPGAASGRMVDARSGAGIPDAEVRLTAAEGVCPDVTTKTDATGAFAVSDLCGEAKWLATPADPGWYTPEPAPAGPNVELRAWRAPPDAGVYTVAGNAITPVVTHTVLDTVRVFGGAEEVRFPVEIPGELPRITGETALLLVGDVLPDLTFTPLVPSAERRWFGTKEAPQPIDPWVYLGVRFTSDTDYERVTASLDTGKITKVGGSRALRYVAGDALPAGRYALPTKDGARAFLFDFGAAPTE